MHAEQGDKQNVCSRGERYMEIMSCRICCYGEVRYRRHVGIGVGRFVCFIKKTKFVMAVSQHIPGKPIGSCPELIGDEYGLIRDTLKTSI